MIIGLVGFKQVGKSTAAEHLESKGFHRHNFKDALVKEMKDNLPDVLETLRDQLERSQMEEWTIERLFEEKPPLMRALMQNYGTDVRRKEDENYWTNQWSRKIDDLSLDAKMVVDDVRFLNEAAAVKYHSDGVIVRLTRPDIESGGTHASETEQLEIEADYTIDCEPGNHQKLYDELDKIIAKI